jgi:hypothetical protein
VCIGILQIPIQKYYLVNLVINYLEVLAMGDEDRERRRAALLAMQPPQAGGVADQRQQPRAPEYAPPRDLSQIRPVVRDTVGEQERRAELVVNTTWKLFQNAIG